MAVVAIRRLAGGLVEVLFGLPDLTRQRVIMPVSMMSFDELQWTGAALTVLGQMRGWPT